MFVSCNGPKKNKVDRSVKKVFFGQKVCSMHCSRKEISFDRNVLKKG